MKQACLKGVNRLKINLQRLREELRKAPAYEPPEKGTGYRYVYEIGRAHV